MNRYETRMIVLTAALFGLVFCLVTSGAVVGIPAAANSGPCASLISALPGPPQYKHGRSLPANQQADLEDSQPVFNVRDHGARGDGVADDTRPIQKAVDRLYAQGGGVLRFPAGTYLVTSVNLREGITYQGEGGAVIKRPDHLFRAQGKKRTFTNHLQAYSGNSDSRPLIIRDLTFDGNSRNQGSYKKYEQEHADLLFLTGKADRPGRLQVLIERCTFKNSVSDGISVFKNVSIQVNRCTAINCFRGGFLVLGGNTVAEVKDFTTKGGRGLDVELGGNSAGYGDRRRVELTLENLNLETGFDVGVSDGSAVVGKNLVAGAPFNLVARGSSVRLSQCRFGVGRGNRIVWPHDVVFDRCEFSATGAGAVGSGTNLSAAPLVAWNLSGTSEKHQNLTFNECIFRPGEDVPANEVVYGILTGWDVPGYDNVLTVKGGHITKKIRVGIGMASRGGTWRITGTRIEAALPLKWTGYKDALGEAYGDVRLDGVIIQSNKYMHIDGYPHPNQNRLEHKNITIDEAANYLTSSYGLEGNRYVGRRLISGSKPPTGATHGLPGDIYRLQGSQAEWVCTRAGYFNDRQKKPVDAHWQSR
jgi:Pectate lyase superfamily protein